MNVVSLDGALTSLDQVSLRR